jgi:diguanylate cyclase (GGDEF)-like protein/PAS domain S-box-containing protein
MHGSSEASSASPASRPPDEESAVDAAHLQLQRIFDNAPGFTAILRGPDLIFDHVNHGYKQLLGERQYLGKPIRDVFPEPGAKPFLDILEHVFRTAQPYVAHEVQAYLAPGLHAPPVDMYLDLVYQPIFSDSGAVHGVLIHGYDVTARKRAQEEVKASEERLRLALELVGDAVWDFNVGERTCVFSKRVKAILGYCDEEIGNGVEAWLALLHPDDRERASEAMQACIEGKATHYVCDHRMRCKDGTWKWLLSRGAPVGRDGSGCATRIVGTLVDISTEQELLQRANYDPLTGIPNRRLFRDRLEQEVKHSQRTGLRLALLFIDLDRFKEVNDWLGHRAGDNLLQEASRRIQYSVRQADTVARLGGDEFTVILPEIEDAQHVARIARSILESLSHPFYLDEELVQVSGSIGIAVYPVDAATPDELLRSADQAMYVAKNAGRNQYCFFKSSMQQAAIMRLKLINDLRRAVPEQQLQLYFQPMVELGSGQVVKAEALLRWRHPRKGLLPPAGFIGIAEETGLINELGDWAFTQAAYWSQRWSSQLGTPFQVSINRSPVQFLPHANAVDWAAHLNRIGLAHKSLSVEITEGLLLNVSPGVADQIAELQAAGMELSIDDFGTGYSSMAYLKKFDIDYLKVDGSFVRDMLTDESSRTITETIIVMAHKLGLRVIAECVEKAEQKDWLTEVGCDYAQGYLFSEPVPARAFEKMFIRH